MRKNLLSVFLFFTFLTSFSQLKQLTIEDAMINARTSLAPENLKQLQFIKGTDDYVYLKKVDGKDTWMKGNFVTKEDAPFLSLTRLNEKLRNADSDTLTAMPAIQFSKDGITLTVKGAKKFIGFDGTAKTIISAETSDKDIVEES